MYFYIFESSPRNQQNNLEERVRDYVSDLGIAGEITAPSSLKPLEHLVSEAQEKKYSTIVAVGGIKHLTNVASCVAGSSLVLGMIPLAQSPNLNQLLHITNWKEAALALKARRFIEARMGIIEPSRDVFLTSCQIKLANLKKGLITFTGYEVEFSGNLMEISLNAEESLLTFKIQGKEKLSVFKFFTFGGENKTDLYSSQFKSKKGFIKTDPPLPIFIENIEIAKTPVTVSLHHKKIKIIVAKKI